MRETHRGSSMENLLAAGLFIYVVGACIMAVFDPPSISTGGVAFGTLVWTTPQQAQAVQAAKPVVKPRNVSHVANVALEAKPTRDVSCLTVDMNAPLECWPDLQAEPVRLQAL